MRDRSARAMGILQTLEATQRGRPVVAQITAVNAFYNRRIRFVADQLTWGVEDYWATPIELLTLGQGDCEDFAIAKYFTLLELGVPERQLRLVYARVQLPATPSGPSTTQAHMVLAYYAEENDDPQILDNLTEDVRPASARPDLAAVFSFNSKGLWVGIGAVRAGDPLARLPRWRDLLARVHAESFH